MKPSKDDDLERQARNRLMFWLMAAVTAWGALLSLGVLLFGINDEGTVSFAVQPRRGLIALLTVLGFLAVWIVTDLWRRRRIRIREARLAAAKLADEVEASGGAVTKER